MKFWKSLTRRAVPLLLAAALLAGHLPAARAAGRFTDVPGDAYYAEAVDWAVERGVTQGTGGGTFSPERTVTRAEAVTFLWRAAGEPEPSSTAQRTAS